GSPRGGQCRSSREQGRRQRTQPPLDRLVLSVPERLLPLPLDEVHRALPMPSLQCVLDRRLGHVLRLIPGSRPLVQRPYLHSRRPYPCAQYDPEEGMVAIPASLLVQWDQEQVCCFQSLQHRLPPRLACDRLAQRPTQPVQERSLAEKPLDFF